jgi:hypothetical protein
MLPRRKDVEDSGKCSSLAPLCRPIATLTTSAGPHTDQCPARVGFYLPQGLVNLNENGPDDGGLMVLRGSSQLFEQYFDEIDGRKDLKATDWGSWDWRMFTEEELEWFYARGCKWEKVCMGPGDLVLWDSRYDSSPS